MIRLPSRLEQELAALFPRLRDREQFVADAVEETIAREPGFAEALPEHVGGTLHLFTDGGSRGNPGEAAIAYILEDPARGVPLREHAERIGIETNNVAEYRALIEGLKTALRYQPNRLIAHLDSELIVKQLNGEYQVRMPALESLHRKAKELSLQFSDILFKHIPRTDNYRADALVNRALDHQPFPRYAKP